MILRLFALIIPAALIYSIGDLVFDINPTPEEITVVVIATAASLIMHDEVKDWQEDRKRVKTWLENQRRDEN